MEAMEKGMKNKTFLLTYVENSPLAENEYADVFPRQVTLNDLFA